MSDEPQSDNPYTGGGAAAPSPLDLRRDELTQRLREARAALSPKAAVAAAAGSGAIEEAAALGSSTLAARARQSSFQPKSMTMRLILERPDVTLRVVLAIATLLFGARLARQFGSAAVLIRTLKSTLDSVSAPPRG